MAPSNTGCPWSTTRRRWGAAWNKDNGILRISGGPPGKALSCYLNDCCYLGREIAGVRILEAILRFQGTMKFAPQGGMVRVWIRFEIRLVQVLSEL